MVAKLSNKKVAILAEEGFEEVELAEPLYSLDAEGAVVHVISPHKKKIKAWNKTDWGQEYDVDLLLSEADPTIYDALVLPGGVINPDRLRVNSDAINFINHFIKNKKIIAAICHGPWSLIETGFVRGKQMTSYISIKTDLINAGANWQDKNVVIDDHLITSRHPGDLVAFIDAIVEKVKS